MKSNETKELNKICNKIRQLKENEVWKNTILKRDCKTYPDIPKGVQVHHVISLKNIVKTNKITNMEEAKDCDILWNTDNGITLCQDCHKKTDNYKNKKKIK